MKKEDIILKLTSKGASSRENLIISCDTKNPLFGYDLLILMENDHNALFIDEKENIYFRKGPSIFVIDKDGGLDVLAFSKNTFTSKYYKILSIAEDKHYYDKTKNINVVPILNEDVIKELNKGNRLLFSINDISGELVLVKNYLSIAIDSNEFEKESLPGVILTALLKGNWEKIVG